MRIRNLWLFFLNFFILQWFFIRLVYGYFYETKDYYYKGEKYILHKKIIPLTGWFNDYKYIVKNNKNKGNL